METLVLATDTSPTRFAFDAFSANLQAQTQRLQVPEADATQRYLPIDPYSELFCLAVQQDVDIDLVRGDQSLRYLGGVGCLLRLSPETQVGHASKPRAELRLVA